MKPDKTDGTTKSRKEVSVSSRPFQHPTTSDTTEDVKRPAPAAGPHEHTRGRAWDSEDEALDDTDTDVLPRDRDLVDETEDRE